MNEHETPVELQRRGKSTGGKLSLCHCVQHKSGMRWPGNESEKARRLLLLHNDLRWSQLACSVDYIQLNSVRLYYLGNAYVMEKRSRKFCKKVALVNSAA